MAVMDIMPWVSPLGGTYEVRWGPVTASQVFDTGEPVNVVTAGTITEAPQDTTEWVTADFTTAGTAALQGGIAVMGPAGGAQTNDRSAALNPATGVAYATNDDVAYWPINQGILFITENFWAAGAGSAATPVQTDIGENYQISHATFGTPDAGWGVEQTAATIGTDVVAGVVEVLDAAKSPIRITGQTGVFVVFTIEATLATT